MTWAPSHIEIGLLGELLRYANIIDGLNEKEKRTLKRKLELLTEEGENYCLYEQDLKNLFDKTSEKAWIWTLKIGKDNKREMSFCPELSVGYIEHIKKIIEPYTR